MKKTALICLLCLLLVMVLTLTVSALDVQENGEGDSIDWNDFWGDGAPNGTDGANNSGATNAGDTTVKVDENGNPVVTDEKGNVVEDKKGCGSAILALPLLMGTAVTAIAVTQKSRRA